MDLRPLESGPTPAQAPASLWLLRHGTSAGNEAAQAAWRAGALTVDIEDRDADVELTTEGQAQADAVGAWMAALPADQRPTVVITSPYRRAVGTAERVVAALRAAPGGEEPLFRSDERLRERDQGALERLTGQGVARELPEEAERKDLLGKVWYRPPGGESWADVLLRVRSLLSLDLPRFAFQRVLLVSHQAVIMNVRTALEGLDEDTAVSIDEGQPQGNCALTRYVRGPGGLHLEVYADLTPVREGTRLLALRR